jgi:hypothetical protein
LIIKQLPEKIKELEGQWVALDKTSQGIINSASILKELRRKIAKSSKSQNLMLIICPGFNEV